MLQLHKQRSMASNSSQKRAYPFSKDQDIMTRRLDKVPKASPVIQDLPSTERDVLEHAARILNKPLSELLNNSIAPAIQPHAAPPFIFTEPQASMPFNGHAAESIPWLSDPWTPVIDDHPQHPDLSPFPMAGYGMFSQPGQFDANNWRAPAQVSPPLVHDAQANRSDQTHNEERGVDDSDKSSAASDTALDHLEDNQPWEQVQIQSVAMMAAPTDPSSSDYIWLSQDLEAHPEPVRAAPPEPAPPSRSTQLVRTNTNERAAGLESTQQRSRRPFQNQTLREETSNTRKLKACVRCRMQRIRCVIDENDPTGVCKTCQGVSNQRLYTLPCARYKITESTLYRTGKAPGLEFTFRWPIMKLKDINKWASDDVRDIKISSDVCPVPFSLSARRFVPIPQDSLKRGWMDGKVKKFKETTPYAIVNMANAVKDMKDYINNNVFECMNFYLRGSDALVKETYDFAIRHTERHRDDEEGLLMGNFFRLWFAIRRTHTVEHIVGEETLDMRPETTDTSYPLFGKIPLPPIMIQQLDMILTLGILQPLKKKVLEDLQKLILSNKTSSWMTVYLITFMSMHSCAILTAKAYSGARKHGLKRRYAMPDFVAESHHAANVFLSHYHYRTQPCDPFKLDWKKRQETPFAEMTPNEILFLMRTKDLVAERKSKFRTAHEISLYEDEMYFISQMYEDNWQPRDTEIDYSDGTVNNVPLRVYV